MTIKNNTDHSDHTDLVLLVADAPDLRQKITHTLTNLSCQVIPAENDATALGKIKEFNPSIILLDVHTPGIPGIALLERIREENPDTEVIMITGPQDMDLAMTSLKMGAVDFITKSVDDDALLMALKRARERIDMREQIRAYAEKLEEINRQEAGHLNISQQSYQQLFDRSPCYITVQDQGLKLTAANKRFTADFDGRIGMHCYQAYKQRTTPCPDCPVENSFKDGRPHQSEMQVTDKNNEQCHLFIATAPILDDAGRVTQVIEMSTNITELRHLQDHLSTLGLRISSISHGVKGLLANLDGGMYLLETGFHKNDRGKTQEGLEIVKFTANRIRRMILDILFFAKERPFQLEKTDTQKFAEEIASTFEARLRGKNIDFVYQTGRTPTAVEVDPTVMRTALLNILDNAADACIDDLSGKPKKINFRWDVNGDYLIFDVIDNGVGMNKETLENLFDLFFSSKGHRGTGIGLFLAYQVITQHNGTIHVSSQIGKGAHFRVVIPKMQTEIEIGMDTHTAKTTAPATCSKLTGISKIDPDEKFING